MTKSARLLPKFKVGISMVILLLLARAEAAKIRGEIADFKLHSCGAKKCLVIQSNKALMATMPMNYAFDSAVVLITDRKTKLEIRLQSKDTYYDSNLNKVFIRQIDSYKNSEAIYDLVTEELSFVRLAGQW